MKKAFTMIEIIFVIVILGIISGIATMHLAFTRSDAEISAALTNIKTLLSDASSYFMSKGNFDSVNKNEKISWKVFTNVILHNQQGEVVSENDKINTPAILRVNNKNCIEVAINDITNNKLPAYISFKEIGNSFLCNAVKNADEIKRFTNGKLFDIDGNVIALENTDGAVLLSSATAIYALNDINTTINNNADDNISKDKNITTDNANSDINNSGNNITSSVVPTKPSQNDFNLEVPWCSGANCFSSDVFFDSADDIVLNDFEKWISDYKAFVDSGNASLDDWTEILNEYKQWLKDNNRNPQTDLLKNYL